MSGATPKQDSTAFQILCGKDEKAFDVPEETAKVVLAESTYFRAAFSSEMQEGTTRILKKPSWNVRTAELVVDFISSGSLYEIEATDVPGLLLAIQELCLKVQEAGGIFHSTSLEKATSFFSSNVPWDILDRKDQLGSISLEFDQKSSLKLIDEGKLQELSDKGLVPIPTDEYHFRWTEKDRSQEPKTAYGGLMTRSDEAWNLLATPYGGRVSHKYTFYHDSSLSIVDCIRLIRTALGKEKKECEGKTLSTGISIASGAPLHLPDGRYKKKRKKEGLNGGKSGGFKFELSGLDSWKPIADMLMFARDKNRYGWSHEKFDSQVNCEKCVVQLDNPTSETVEQCLPLAVSRCFVDLAKMRIFILIKWGDVLALANSGQPAASSKQQMNMCMKFVDKCPFTQKR